MSKLKLMVYKLRRCGKREWWNGISWTRDETKAKRLDMTRENTDFLKNIVKSSRDSNGVVEISIAMCNGTPDMSFFER